jgi:SLOG cluster2
MPGIIEEALNTLDARHLLISLGGFGGAARDVAIALDLLADDQRIAHAQMVKYAIRLPANRVLQERIGHLLTRPVGRPPGEVRRSYATRDADRRRFRLMILNTKWVIGSSSDKEFCVGAERRNAC